MGFFNKLFKTDQDIAKKEIVEIPWHMLTSEVDLEQLEKESESKLVVIFKHSTRCGISRMVLKGFEKELDVSEEQVKLYFLDILNNRGVSNEIASRFQITHESPQLIVLKNREVVHHASHNGISADDLKKFI